MTNDKGGHRGRRSDRKNQGNRADKIQIAKQIGIRIRDIRQGKNLSQAELAEQLGISHGTVSYWERGGNAKPDNLRNFAKLCSVSMEWLTNGIDVEAAFHPRWIQIEGRLRHRPNEELEELFDLFDFYLDQRDRQIERDKKKRR
jgi:transcriptional regulator with XRE-family HTH domain